MGIKKHFKIRIMPVTGNGVVIDPTIPSYEQHPFFVKKTEEAKAFLKKHPVPQHLLDAAKR